MAIDELSKHLESLQRDECYHIDSILKTTDFEETQKVFFIGANGAKKGPYIRKYIDVSSGLGKAYESLFLAQKLGKRFRYLPAIYDCYKLGDKFTVIMEHAPGETLQEVVYRCDPSLPLVYDIFPRVCDAVIELHTEFDPPLIHRDLKPSNIMVTSDSLTIIDFGIARSFNAEADEDTHRFGTKAYAPPEQFGYGQTDVRSDVYALGALLYFCLFEKTFDHNAKELLFPNSDIFEPLRSLILTATQFSPKDRFENVEALKNAFLLAFDTSDLRFEKNGGERNSTRNDKQRSLYHTSYPDNPAFEKESQFKLNFLSQIPPKLGIAWNIFVGLFFILIAVFAVIQIVNPLEGSASAALPFWIRAIQHIAIIILFFAPLAYLFCDKRPFVKHLSWYSKISPLRDIVVVVGLFVLCLVVFGIVGIFY